MNKAKNNQSETGQNSLFQDKLFITCQPSDWSKNTGDPENLMHSRVHSAICMAWVVRKPFEVFLLFLRNIVVNAVKKIMVCIKELKKEILTGGGKNTPFERWEDTLIYVTNNHKMKACTHVLPDQKEQEEI